MGLGVTMCAAWWGVLGYLTIRRVAAAVGSRVEVVKGRVEEVILQTKVRRWRLCSMEASHRHQLCPTEPALVQAPRNTPIVPCVA